MAVSTRATEAWVRWRPWKKGSKDRYFQANETDAKKLVPEGIAARVPYKGLLYEVVYQMLGGLRSGMGYCGARDIELSITPNSHA